MLHGISALGGTSDVEMNGEAAALEGGACSGALASLLETGLDFAGLASARREHGLRAMLPLCPRPQQPALAAYLDREPTIYPRYQWDDAAPLPRRETLYVLSCASLGRLTALCQVLLRRRLPDICFIVDGAALAALKGEDVARAEPLWHLVFSLSATSERDEEKLLWVQAEVAGHCREAGLERQLYDFVPQHETLHRRLLNPAENRQWWKLAGMAATRELRFQTTLDRCESLLPVLRLQRRLYGWRGRPLVYIQPELGGRLCHMEFVFPHEPAPQRTPALAAFLSGLTAELKREGAFFSRACAAPEPAVEAGRPLHRDLGDGFLGMFAPKSLMASTGRLNLGRVQAA